MSDGFGLKGHAFILREIASASGRLRGSHAWLIERQIVFSAEVRALSRPSGRPTASSAPRTTRWVCRWTRWSAGLPEATPMVAIEYERAKSFET